MSSVWHVNVNSPELIQYFAVSIFFLKKIILKMFLKSNHFFTGHSSSI